MEGQVRGIARMVERDEYCIDILQQTAALRAAVDAVTPAADGGPRRRLPRDGGQDRRRRGLHRRGHGGRAAEHGPAGDGAEFHRDPIASDESTYGPRRAGCPRNSPAASTIVDNTHRRGPASTPETARACTPGTSAGPGNDQVWVTPPGRDPGRPGSHTDRVAQDRTVVGAHAPGVGSDDSPEPSCDDDRGRRPFVAPDAFPPPVSRPDAGSPSAPRPNAFRCPPTPATPAGAGRAVRGRPARGPAVARPDPDPGRGAGDRRPSRLLLAWNAHINLTAIRTPRRVARLHVVDSLSAVPVLRGGSATLRPSWTSGAAAAIPGLPLGRGAPGEPRGARRIRSPRRCASWRSPRRAAAAPWPRPVRAGSHRGDRGAGGAAGRWRPSRVLGRGHGRGPWARSREVAELGMPLLRRGGLLVLLEARRRPEVQLARAGRARRGSCATRGALGGLGADDAEVRAPSEPRGLPGHRLVAACARTGRRRDGSRARPRSAERRLLR